MINATVGFVGGSRITGIILDGLKRASALPATVVVSDQAAGVLARLKERHPRVTVSTDNAVPASQDLVFMAVHPPLMAEVAGQVKAGLKAGSVVVSLAPKFTIGKLAALLGMKRIARVIPNAPSLIGSGFNPMSFAPELADADRQLLRSIFAPLGDCPEVAEAKLEAYAVLTAMGPTYLWFQLCELVALGESFGLTREESLAGVEKMASGAARTLARSGLSSDQVKDLVPVKPLGDLEPAWGEAYRTRLTGIFQKIKP